MNENPLYTNKAFFEYGENYFDKVLLSPTTLAKIASSYELWQELLSFHETLITDKVGQYLNMYYYEGLKRYGKNWFYLDIVNVLYAASRTIKPKNYLEIGVRRGRSSCLVARGNPQTNIFGFDIWIPNYADIENPGPEFVKRQLDNHNHQGKLFLISGNSHKTIPDFFRQFPEKEFDLITVDGDHTEKGALDDLNNIVDHLAIGGILVFDDITHPKHPYLLKVWRQFMYKNKNLTSYEYTELGNGIAFAIRMK